MKPILKSHTDLLNRLELFKEINTDVNDRWEKGIEHRLDTQEFFITLAAADWLFTDDFFCFKSGGDGDNGETLMYLLDIIFELKEKEENTWVSEYEK